MMLVMGAAPILAPLGGAGCWVHGSWHWIFGFLAAFALLCLLLVACISRSRIGASAQRIAPALARGALPLFADRASSGRRWFSSAPFGAFLAYLARRPSSTSSTRRAGGPVRLYFGPVRRASSPCRSSTAGWFRAMARGASSLGRIRVAAGAAALLGCALTGLFGFAGVFLPIFVMIGAVGFIASNGPR